MMTKADNQALIDLTRMTIGLLDGWRLDIDEMQALLGLPEKVRSRAFQKFRAGREALPAEPEVLRRAQYLIRIADALRTTYPRNPYMGAQWMRQRHRRFGGRTPLMVILEGGESGLMSVLAELDCTFAWDMTGSEHTAYPGAS